MIRNNKFLLTVTIFLASVSLLSCASKDERKIVSQIKKTNFVDLSLYCTEFDKIIIYNEGYYYESDKNQWPGTKIYYFDGRNIKKIINLHYCADEPFGNVIHFTDYNDGKIVRSRENAVFYLSHIFEYDKGNILQLSSKKTNTKIWKFK